MNILVEIKKAFPAFLIAPAIPVCLITTIAVSGGGSGAVWLFLFSGLIAYGLTFAFGIPAYLILKKCDCVGLITLMFLGAFLALVPIYFLVLSPRLDLINKGLVESLMTYSVVLQVSIFLMLAFIGSFSFWFVLNGKHKT